MLEFHVTIWWPFSTFLFPLVLFFFLLSFFLYKIPPKLIIFRKNVEFLHKNLSRFFYLLFLSLTGLFFSTIFLWLVLFGLGAYLCSIFIFFALKEILGGIDR